MDRRQFKTRQAIFNAFGTLLQKKRYENITVQEIIDEAGSGLIIPKNDNEALYRAMKSVIEDKTIVASWKNTLSATKERFSYKNRAERLYELFGMD